MIPMHFGYAYWDADASDEKPVFVSIHGHCWVDPSHVITMSVVKKVKDESVLFSCEECQVKERTVRCRKRKCLETVSA